MDFRVILGLGVAGLAVTGFVTIVRAIFRAPRVAAAAPHPPLTRLEKLRIAEELLLERPPGELLAELDDWRRGTGQAPRGVVDLSPSPPEPVVHEDGPDHEDAPDHPDADHAPTFHVDDRPLHPPTAVAVVVDAANPVLRRFLSFENIIFSLAGCLILGGTLYVIATTWGRVPDRWQYFYAEGVILFYGILLLGWTGFIERRLELPGVARVFAAITAVMAIGATLVAARDLHTSLLSGTIGVIAAAGLGYLGVRRLFLAERRPPRDAFFFALSVALLAGAGGLASWNEFAASAVAGASIATGGLLLRNADSPPRLTFLMAAAPAIGALVLPASAGLPVALLAPALGVVVHAARPVVRWLPLSVVGFFTLVAVGATLLMGAARPGALWLTAAVELPAVIALVVVSGAGAAMPWLALAGLLITLALGWPAAAGLVNWPWWPLLPAGVIDVYTAAPLVAAGAVPWAVALFAVSRWRDTEKPGAGEPFAAIAYLILVGALAAALFKYPESRWPAAGALLAIAIAERGFVRFNAPAWPSVRAHGFAAVAAFAVGKVFGLEFALGALGVYGLALIVRPGRPGFFLGSALVPFASGWCLVENVVHWLPAGLLFPFGILQLVLPRSSVAAFTRSLGFPALLVSVLLALFAQAGAEPALLAGKHFGLALSVGLLPAALWVALRGGPRFLAVEVALGLCVAMFTGGALPALVVAIPLLAGRDEWSVVATTIIATVMGTVAVASGASPALVGPPLAACGAILLGRSLSGKTALVRWFGLPFALAALSVAIFHRPDGRPAIDLEFLPAVWTVSLLPGLGWIVWRRTRNRDAITVETMVGGIAFAFAATVVAMGSRYEESTPVVSGGAALLALAITLAAAAFVPDKVPRAIWFIVLLAAPWPVVPMTLLPFDWPAALTAVGAVVTLLRVSRRRGDAVMAAVGLSLGLAALAWACAPVAKQFSRGGGSFRHLPLLAVIVAGYGVASGAVGARVSAASEGFLRRFSVITLLVGHGLLLLGIASRAYLDNAEVAKVLSAFALLGLFSVITAIRVRRGWPFLLAEGTLGFSYAYLRARTNWLNALGGWDGLAVCLVGFVSSAIRSSLRRLRESVGPAGALGLAGVWPLLSVFFFRLDDPRASVGLGFAAAYFVLQAHRQDRPWLGWVAGALLNLGLLPLWQHFDWRSPTLHALPIGTTLGLLGHIYRSQLGTSAPMVRTLASLVVFGVTSFEMFAFESPAPALVLAACATVAVLLGILGRVRSYLYLGFFTLIMDIVVNLTRFGMRDRLTGGLLGLGAGVLLLVLGVLVARHKRSLLNRYRIVKGWNW